MTLSAWASLRWGGTNGLRECDSRLSVSHDLAVRLKLVVKKKRKGFELRSNFIAQLKFCLVSAEKDFLCKIYKIVALGPFCNA